MPGAQRPSDPRVGDGGVNVHSQQHFKQTLCPGLYTRAPCPTLVLNITAPSLRVSVCYLSKLDISLGVSPASQSEAGETWTMNMPCSGLAMNPKEEGAVRVLASLFSAGAALASGAGGGLIPPPSTSRGPMAGLQESQGEVQASVGQCFRQRHPWPRAD